jgi:GNAT superfamily N-acetyltransferase
VIVPLKNIMVRRAQDASDILFLWDMLYEAAAVDVTIKAMNKEDALKLPGISKYLSEWGRRGDTALIAYNDITKEPVGAIWYRLFSYDAPGYGYVADDIPELSMAITLENRGKGIGNLLLHAIIEEAKKNGHRALSLSVDKHNRARKLYESVGFIDAELSKPEDTSITMKINLYK